MTAKTRIVLLGGGFGGATAALEFERLFGRAEDVDLTLVNRDNFFLFTPMLHEVAAGDLDPVHVVNPLRKMLRRTNLFHGEVLEVDLTRKRVVVAHGADRAHTHEIPFDHLVLALGNVTSFHGVPGAESRALTMKSLGDAFALRNRVVECLEEADFECCPLTRERMLTFVVAGGGFAGVETAAAVHDFAEAALDRYPNIDRNSLRVVLVHSGKSLLPELHASLGAYTARKLAERGLDVRLGARVAGVDDAHVTLDDGARVAAHTLVWTAGSAPHPLLKALPCSVEKGRVPVDETLAVKGYPGVWALGDCAVVPDAGSARGSCPPTAQHASRQGVVLARNVFAAVRGGRPTPFRFKTLGQLASLGRRTGVAEILGWRFSGFVAWWLWRTMYLLKLPRLERKIRVALDWTLDLAFSKDLVHLPTALGSARRVPEGAAATPPVKRASADLVAVAG